MDVAENAPLALRNRRASPGKHRQAMNFVEIDSIKRKHSSYSSDYDDLEFNLQLLPLNVFNEKRTGRS